MRINDDGVIDHEIARHLDVDLAEVLSQPIHRRTHRREIDDCQHTRKILEHDAGRFECDLGTRVLLRFPGENLEHVFFGHPKSVDVSQSALEENADRVRQPRDVSRAQTIQARDIVVSDLT